jgi:predicted permease
MAMRVVLGAGRGRLASQLLIESVVWALLGGAAGAIAAHWGARAVVAFIPKSVTAPGLADVRINGQVLLFAFIVSIATALVFSLVSLLMARRTTASGAIGAPLRVSMSAAAHRAASGLVVIEVALAVVLLIGLGLILRTFDHLLSVDPGFRSERVLTLDISLPANRYNNATATRAFFDDAFAKLRALPQVQQAGAAVVVPLTGNNWTAPFERPEQPVPAGERAPDVGWQSASGGYFQAMQIPLISGRLFDERDRPDSKPVVIISEAIQQRFFRNESAVGKQVKVGKANAEIVGVVGNIRRAGLRDEPRADMYFPFERFPSNSITLFVRTVSDPLSNVSNIQATLRSIEPAIVIARTRTLDEVAAESVRETKLALWLLGAFGVTALALCAVGVYGVMSYVVRQRTRELGTRVALGATRGDIVWLVMRQGAVIAVLGTILGLGAGLMTGRFFAAMLYGVSTYDPMTLAVASIVLIGTTLAACYIPARRAASIDPARTLSVQ